MKKYLLVLFLLFCFESSFTQELSNEAKQKIKESLLNNNSLGKYFVVAFPPNDSPNQTRQIMALYISSTENTYVNIKRTDGSWMSAYVFKNEITSVNTESILTWNMMLDDQDNEIVSNKGLVIMSSKPISVYVMSSKAFTSDGYLAIPVKSWGTEYIHCSYWDFKEARNWKSGFTVLAAEDRTKIEIVLKGRGENYKTLNGHSLGDTITKILNAGQTYMVQGSGESRGEFDLTGSIIKADKPIAIISSHERAIIPVFTSTFGRDHLAAMPPPVSNWSKEYVTLELDRATNKGDYFRVVAAEDNTYFEVKWFDKITGKLIGSWDGILDKKGDFDEYSKVSAKMPHINESVRGIAHFKADKPIIVMQYSYSADWDNSPNGTFDPFMFPVTNIEQFTNGTIFQTPSNESNNEFTKNYLNLTILADAETEQERIELLKTLMLDSIPLYEIYPELLAQKFPTLHSDYNEKLYWLTAKTDIGSHTLKGDVKFGAYVYGYAEVDSYGWPAASGYYDLTTIDTLDPVVSVIENDKCGNLTLKANDRTNMSIPEGCQDCLPQIDQGFNQLPIVVNNNNFSPALINYETMTDIKKENGWFDIPTVKELDLNYRVGSVRKDAELHLLIPDKSLINFTEYKYNYYADTLKKDVLLEFILKEIDKSHIIKFKLTSDKNYETNINELKVLNKVGNYFKVLSPIAPFTIDAKSDVEVVLEYTPTRHFTEAEKYGDGNYDLDSLVIITDCITNTYPIRGWGVTATSVSTNSDIDGLDLYPNPSSDVVNFKSEYNFIRFEVIDLKGNIALEGELVGNAKSINIAKLGNGTYYLRLISDTQSQIGRFQKVR